MSFFDKKTDVIKIELTQYGKQMLAKGKFKPVYYEFFDNDVIYDSKYAGLQEKRNNIQERIKNQTPYLKPQYNFSGVETNLKTQIELKKLIKDLIDHRNLKNPNAFSNQNIEEKININSYPLGTSLLNNKTPTISVYSGDTAFSSSLKYNDSSGYVIMIPQLILDNPTYEYEAKNSTDANRLINNNIRTTSFEDGSFFEVSEETILLKVEETNVKDIINNFDIEIFEVTSSKGRDVYLPLYFTQEPDDIDPSCVEYYFDVSVDNEISSNDLDKFDQRLKNPRLFVEIK